MPRRRLSRFEFEAEMARVGERMVGAAQIFSVRKRSGAEQWLRSFLNQRRYTPAAETAAQLENNPGMKLKTKVKEKFKSRETPLLREVSYMKLKDMT